jgi:hypothetical protein
MDTNPIRPTLRPFVFIGVDSWFKNASEDLPGNDEPLTANRWPGNLMRFRAMKYAG